MTLLTLELPAMYGDHHVVEVKRLLMDLDGVQEVYASSAFRAAEITYNSRKVKKAEITATLEKAGYIGELPIPVESGEPLYGRKNGGSTYRHTAALGEMATANEVSFTQEVNYSGRPLWPCPGMGPITGMDEEG